MLSDLKIRTKLLVAFTVAALGLVGVGVVSYSAMDDLTTNTVELSDNLLPSLRGLAELHEGFTASRFYSGKAIAAVLANDPRLVATYWERRQAARARVEHGIAIYGALPMMAEEKQLWDRIVPGVQAYFAENQRVWDSVNGGDGRAANARQDAYVQELTDRVITPLDQLFALQEKLGKDLKADSEADAARARRLLWAIVLAMLAGVTALGVWITGSVARTLARLAAESGALRAAVAEGRLSARADPAVVGAEFRPILTGLNQTLDAFEKPMRTTSDCLVRISNGDLPPPVTEAASGDFARINEALNRCIGAVNLLVQDTTALAKAAVAGDLERRADASRHQGDFRRTIEGVNATLDTVVDKNLWYEAILDAVPFPVHVTDADMKWTFMNKPFEQLMVSEKRITDRKAAVGLPCSTAAANICNTEKCGIVQLGKGKRESFFDWCGMSCKQDTTHLLDRRGQRIGYVEVVQDLTAMIRQRDYTAHEVERVAQNLGRLAAGDLACDFAVKEADQHTGQAREHFTKINGSLKAVKNAIEALVQDTGTLSRAAVEGALSTRVDGARHQGEYRKVVDGVNATLDAVIAPLNEAAAVLDRLARRDLRVRMEGDYRGDHARIKEALNATAGALHDAIAQVAEAVEQVSSAATQIASSSQAVASGASEQASSLEETSSSIESVAGITRTSAENAQQANGLAQTARAAATEGSAAVDQMQGAMAHIKTSAEGTSQIIKDINDIAFQTNLLALNAAVEAARAGEAGRGFAVVAEEVRSLALRSKEAATKTEELIRQSVKQAGEGEVSAKHVATKLGEIVSGVGKVTDIVSEIAAAAKEQTTGIDQVNKAVTEMDKVTQQNAASAEESSSAASELSAQAEELSAMVASFQLDRATRAVTRRPAAAAARPAPAKPVRPRASGPARAADALFPMDADAEVGDF